jgi:hypothetical protein
MASPAGVPLASLADPAPESRVNRPSGWGLPPILSGADRAGVDRTVLRTSRRSRPNVGLHGLSRLAMGGQAA